MTGLFALVPLDPSSIIDSNVIVAFIAAVATVITAIIALRKDKEASPTAIAPQHGASDSGIVAVLATRISELEDRDDHHDKIEAALWAYTHRLQAWGISGGQGPMPLPPASLMEEESESEKA